ncbi:permease [Desulfobulbus propionicus DSM 2032]|uniref:Permease n=1 Tax=Desulfobulbus propionicus (strain ATCC 33891 / DSM 2032 / VKM B-1956 / 1pr3) TaxID=577650 RepID=A0A7U4DNT6_DESPD|nr:permease [Desulfobulbus propionicus]ADW17416.1 permease [Desulfobulbus propionicus DSM 2032]
MEWKVEWKYLLLIIGVFLACYYLPVGTERFDNAILEAFHLVKWYAQEHVLLCLVPAFFIAGAIGVFVSQTSVMKYLGPTANKVIAYGVAAVSGTILAVCSCTILPLFSGIYRMGAGLGPACAFLYSGPAINVLAIILTARILGTEIGVARGVGAVLFSVIIGALMAFIFRSEEQEKATVQMALPEEEVKRSLLQNALYFASMVGVLVFANWGKPQEPVGVWATIYAMKWMITSGFAAALGLILIVWFKMRAWKVGLIAAPVVAFAMFFPEQPVVAFAAGFVGLSIFTSTDKDELGDWFSSSWGFAKQILPLLLFGVLIAGALLGRVGHEGLIPSEWVAKAVGGNSLLANFFASFAGAFMYFATLTEVPIVQGLIGSGMGKGPALALLLAGPALSLPNMLVINSVLGVKKTVTFVSLVIVMATFCGMLFGSFFN